MNRTLRLSLKKDNDIYLIVNKELEIVLKRNDIGYSIDLYSHTGEYITGCQAYDDDLL